MKLNFCAFLLTLAAAQASEQPQTPRRELVETGPIDFNGSGCYDYTPDGTWTQLFRNDDSGLYINNIGIDFPWLGGIKNDIYINNNGNLSFDSIIASFQPTAFATTSTNMIAPFWADVDTRDSIDGYVWYKSIPGSKFIVTWEEVARFGADPIPRRNTFQVVLSDASQPDDHICFCYGGMDWVLGSVTVTGHAQVGIAGGAGNTFNLAQFSLLDDTWNGIGTSGNGVDYLVDKSFCFDSSAIDNPPDEDDLTNDPEVGPGGDPHITTWVGEHYEYHGQCDLTLAKDADFANGLGLDIQIRTKIVRYWSYIKNVAIKIGNDVLEIEGNAENNVDSHYWVNFEYQGELEEFAGFPVTQQLSNVDKRIYTIDLNSKYRGQSIQIVAYKEFLRVKFNGDHRAFGNTVGLLGDYHTGKTLARDGSTVMHDFTELGDEWQVLPTEPKLFREVSKPHFPEPCIKPEDPRGDRKRRLAESSISIEDAEAACANLKDPLSIKDCVYDILATQDMGMVGAF